MSDSSLDQQLALIRNENDLEDFMMYYDIAESDKPAIRKEWVEESNKPQERGVIKWLFGFYLLKKILKRNKCHGCNNRQPWQPGMGYAYKGVPAGVQQPQYPQAPVGSQRPQHPPVFTAPPPSGQPPVPQYPYPSPQQQAYAAQGGPPPMQQNYNGNQQLYPNQPAVNNNNNKPQPFQCSPVYGGCPAQQAAQPHHVGKERKRDKLGKMFTSIASGGKQQKKA